MLQQEQQHNSNNPLTSCRTDGVKNLHCILHTEQSEGETTDNQFALIQDAMCIKIDIEKLTNIF